MPVMASIESGSVQLVDSMPKSMFSATGVFSCDVVGVSGHVALLIIELWFYSYAAETCSPEQ